MRRSLSIDFLAVGISFTLPYSAFAQVIPGRSCTTLGKTQISNGYKYTCIKSPRSLSNPLGKKLIWNNCVLLPKPKTLEEARTANERLTALNALGLGVWKQIDNQGFNAQAFISTWPCLIYMANDLDSAVEIYNNKVNYNFYGGFWLGIQSQKWVVNQPYNDDKTCVRYFARKYGGRIYNGNTQN